MLSLTGTRITCLMDHHWKNRLSKSPLPDAICQMKAGKAQGPSGIVVEMIQVAGDTGASMIRDLAAAIILDGKVPSSWEQFHCLPLQG